MGKQANVFSDSSLSGAEVDPGKVKSPASGQPHKELEKAPRENSGHTGMDMEAVTMHRNQPK